jgi:hypothetical protein
LGAVAQLGERLLCKQEVTGSIPVGSTRADLFQEFGSTRADLFQEFGSTRADLIQEFGREQDSVG